MLFDQIQQDMITAMKAGDKIRTETLRFLIAAIKKYEIDTYLPGTTQKLSEDDVRKIIHRQVKTHAESIAAFAKGGRTDLVDREKAELEILKTYVPAEMSDEEVTKIVQEITASGNANFGQIMGMVMQKLAGQASGERVAKIVKETLTQK